MGQPAFINSTAFSFIVISSIRVDSIAIAAVGFGSITAATAIVGSGLVEAAGRLIMVLVATVLGLVIGLAAQMVLVEVRNSLFGPESIEVAAMVVLAAAPIIDGPRMLAIDITKQH